MLMMNKESKKQGSHGDMSSDAGPTVMAKGIASFRCLHLDIERPPSKLNLSSMRLFLSSFSALQTLPRDEQPASTACLLKHSGRTDASRLPPKPSTAPFRKLFLSTSLLPCRPALHESLPHLRKAPTCPPTCLRRLQSPPKTSP